MRLLVRLLSCQPRVTVTSCFLQSYQGLIIDISLVYQIYPSDRINTRVIYRFAISSSEVYTLVFYLAMVNRELGHCHSWLAWGVHVSVLLSNGKQRIRTLSLLVGMAVRLMFLRLFTMPPAENLCKQAVCLSQSNVVLQMACTSRLSDCHKQLARKK